MQLISLQKIYNYAYRKIAFRRKIIHFLDRGNTENNLTLISNLFQKSELTMCFVVESIRIRVASTRKLS